MVPINSPGMISYSTFIDPIVVSVTVLEMFDIKAIFCKGAIVKINSTSGLADMRLLDLHQKQ